MTEYGDTTTMHINVHGPVTNPEVEQLSWSADDPQPSTIIKLGDVTFFVRADQLHEAELAFRFAAMKLLEIQLTNDLAKAKADADDDWTPETVARLEAAQSLVDDCVEEDEPAQEDDGANRAELAAENAWLTHSERPDVTEPDLEPDWVHPDMGSDRI